MGQVCPKHQEFYDTQCRWCEPTQVAAPAYPITQHAMASRVLAAPTERWGAADPYAWVPNGETYLGQAVRQRSVDGMRMISYSYTTHGASVTGRITMDQVE